MKKFKYYTPIVLQKIGYTLFFILYKVFLRVEIKGKENLLNINGPIIIAANHTGELDVTAIPLVLPFFSSFSPIYFVANKTEKYKTFGWRSYVYGGLFFNMLGGYPVYSGHKNYAIALNDFILLLRKGRTVCIFPEGKRTLDGQFNPGRGGLGYLAYTTSATVIPVAIDTFFNLSLWDFIFRRRKLIMTICKPMTSPELVDSFNPKVEDFRNGSQKVLDRIKEQMS